MPIYEIRTYGLAPGSVAEVEARFQEHYEARQKYSPLAAFWHTEIGPLNEIVHVWPYADLAERARVGAEVASAPKWPPRIGQFIVSMQSEILVPFPCSPLLAPGRLGPVYEMRYYATRAGSLPKVMKDWESMLPGRVKLSPLVLVGHVELGEVNRFIHIWAYESLDHRAAVREKAVATGVWPPPGAADTLLTMANKILLPATFSPLC